MYSSAEAKGDRRRSNEADSRERGWENRILYVTLFLGLVLQELDLVSWPWDGEGVKYSGHR